TQPGGAGTTFTVVGTHTYRDENLYPVTVTIQDTLNGLTATALGTALVGDAPLSATGTTKTMTLGTAYVGRTATFTDQEPVEPASNFSALVDWGDGSPLVPGTIQYTGAAFEVTGSHTYTAAGAYLIVVRILDAGGSRAAAVSLAVVTEAAPSVTTAAVNQAPTLPPEATVPPIELLRREQQAVGLLRRVEPAQRGIPADLPPREGFPARRRTFFDDAPGSPARGEINGRVFEDLNGNGLRDPDEHGLAGQTVYLDVNNNGRWDPGAPIPVTNANRDYSFSRPE